jgi:hypothetical protein
LKDLLIARSLAAEKSASVAGLVADLDRRRSELDACGIALNGVLDLLKALGTALPPDRWMVSTIQRSVGHAGPSGEQSQELDDLRSAVTEARRKVGQALFDLTVLTSNFNRYNSAVTGY